MEQYCFINENIDMSGSFYMIRVCIIEKFVKCKLKIWIFSGSIFKIVDFIFKVRFLKEA